MVSDSTPLSDADTLDVSICVCTFRRPAMLEALLEALSTHDLGGFRAELIIVDNDPDHSAQPVCQTWLGRFPFDARILHQATPNIALARNTAIAAARGKAILFIDDDELPEAGWASHMLRTQQASGAEAVIGPVARRYPAATPAWLRDGGFFPTQSHPTGTLLRYQQTYSGNCLLLRRALQDLPGPFDPDFGVTGGSDTMLFRELTLRGARIAWCEEAIVSEEVPSQRANRRWILRRAFRGGQSYVRAELGPLRGLRRAARGTWLGTRALLQAAMALLLALAYLPFSHARAMRWLCKVYAQAGKIGALFGHRYLEYGLTN